MVAEGRFFSDHWRSWVLLLLFAPFTLFQLSISRRRPLDLTRHEKHKLRAKIAPRPLLAPRRRALSAPLIEPEKVGMLRLRMQTTHDQVGCLLLEKLPLEIRELIWSYVLGGYKIRVTKRYRRLGHARCRHVGERCPGDCVGYYDANWYKEAPSLTGCLDDMSAFQQENVENEDDKLLNLLLTCRLIYTEGINLLYSQNTFTVRDLDCITHLSATLLPQRFHRIHTLHVTWCVSGWQNSILRPRATPPYDWGSWETIWGIVASMKALRVLRVGLTTRMLSALTAEEEHRLFRPFRGMTHVQRIEIVTAYPPAKGGEWQAPVEERLVVTRMDESIIDNPPWTFEW